MTARCLYIYVRMLLLLFITSAISSAQTTVFKQYNKVVLTNELVKIEYDLAKGTYSAYSLKDRNTNLVGATLRIDKYSSDTYGLKREWKSSDINDELGNGKKITVSCHGKMVPTLILELSIYDGKSFIVLNGGVKHTLTNIRIGNGNSLIVKDINPLMNACFFDGVKNKTDFRILNGPGGAGMSHNVGRETRVHQMSNMESPNNILATFIADGKRKSVVVGGLTYHEYSKYVTANFVGNKNVSVEAFSWDPVGKKVDTSQVFIPDDKYYVDFCTDNPFESLEQYGMSIKAAQKVNLSHHNFPTVDGWYVAVFSKGGEEQNNSAGMVKLMDGIKESGFLKYSKAAVRLIPDNYGYDNEQGWWDDEHWQKFGHYVKPYETTRKWAQAVIERGGIPLTYSQTSAQSADFMKLHPNMLLDNDERWAFKKNGEKSYLGGLDFTDKETITHMEKVYQNLKDGGVQGLMFDYPEGSFKYFGFEDSYSTSAAAYRTIFEIPKRVLGPDSYIDERNIWTGNAIGKNVEERGCFMDLTAGVVDNQRVWSDNDIVTPEMVSRCGHRWYKNRVIFYYDMDSKDLRKAKPANRDGVRKMLSMAYIVAPRLVLSNSFRTLSSDNIYDLERIYPMHTTPQSARPLDAFIRKDGIPRIYDFKVDDNWHQLAFYNPNDEEQEVVNVSFGESGSFGGMELDPKSNYYVYDFWNNKYIGKYLGKTKFE